MSINTQTLWNTYVGDEAPADFVRRYGMRDPEACARAHVARLPHVHGIVRAYSWRDTFGAPVQYNREQVALALRVHLEDTRAEWESIAADLPEFALPPEETDEPAPTLIIPAPAGDPATEGPLGQAPFPEEN